MQDDLREVQLEHGRLRSCVAEVQERNQLLKSEYDSLFECCQHTEAAYRKEQLYGPELLEDMIRWKQHAAARMTSRYEWTVRCVLAGGYTTLLPV